MAKTVSVVFLSLGAVSLTSELAACLLQWLAAVTGAA